MTQCLICSESYTRTSNRQKWCELCRPAARIQERNRYYADNAETVTAKRREAMAAKRASDPEAARRKNREWWARNREKISERRRTPEAREKTNAYLRQRSDPSRRIHNRMSSGILQAIREKKAGRKWESLVGYTLADLVSHLERQFPKGMTWENMGQWHIDHIRPKKDFDQTDPVQFRECWGLLNLRPLWAPANQAKAGRREHLL